MNELGESVFQVTYQLIHQAFNYPVFGTYVTFTKDSLVSYYDNLSSQESSYALSFLTPKYGQFSPDENFLSLYIFATDIRPILQMISKILGREDSK